MLFNSCHIICFYSLAVIIKMEEETKQYQKKISMLRNVCNKMTENNIFFAYFWNPYYLISRMAAPANPSVERNFSQLK